MHILYAIMRLFKSRESHYHRTFLVREFFPCLDGLRKLNSDHETIIFQFGITNKKNRTKNKNGIVKPSLSDHQTHTLTFFLLVCLSFKSYFALICLVGSAKLRF